MGMESVRPTTTGCRYFSATFFIGLVNSPDCNVHVIDSVSGDRLALIKVIAKVLVKAMDILGISLPERM